MAYRDLIVADGPEQYYRFDRVASEVGWRDTASSGYYEYRMTMYNGATQTPDGGVENSKALNATGAGYAAWNGLLTYSETMFRSSNQTYEMWWKRNNPSLTSDRSLVDRSGSASGYHLMQAGANSTVATPYSVYLEIWNNNGRFRIEGPVINDENWHSIVTTVSTTTYALWVDGVKVTGSITYAGMNQSGTGTAYLGRGRAVANYADSYFDEVVWYKKVLADARIQAHYAAGPPPAPTGYAWSVWDGTTEIPCTMEGVWNGTIVVPRVSEERV